MRQDYIWLKGNHLLGKLRRLRTGRCEANLRAEIATIGPAKSLHFIFEYRKALLCLGVVFSKAHQDRYAADPLGLRACCEGPSNGYTANKLDERAALHAIPFAQKTSYRIKLVCLRAGPCPLWVKSRHMRCKKRCPLYPQ